jgi:hypothetical protein
MRTHPPRHTDRHRLPQMSRMSLLVCLNNMIVNHPRSVNCPAHAPAGIILSRQKSSAIDSKDKTLMFIEEQNVAAFTMVSWYVNLN